jgi:nucleoside-diphosphate-sugar epimerase
VVHLAGDAGSEDFVGSLLPKNVLGVYNILEASRAVGGKLIIIPPPLVCYVSWIITNDICRGA